MYGRRAIDIDLCLFEDCWELSDEGKLKIGMERQKCVDALFKYMCTKCGPSGPGKFGMTLALLPTLCEAAEQHRDRLRVREILLMNKFTDTFMQELILGKDMRL